MKKRIKAFFYNLLFKQKLEHKLSDGFIKWGLKHKNEKNKIVKIFMDELYFVEIFCCFCL